MFASQAVISTLVPPIDPFPLASIQADASGNRSLDGNSASITADAQVIQSVLVAGPAVTGFTLINADTDLPLGPLLNGQTINLRELPTRKLNVRADTSDTIGSIRFDFDGQANFRIESTSPYSLFGDTSGNYKAGLFAVGSHVLAATPFSLKNGNGTAGTALSIQFTVIDESTPSNQPPTVNAGIDQSITLPTTMVNLDGTVADDHFPSNPLTTQWIAASGPGSVAFADASSVDTIATFSAPGVYVLRITAGDGQFIRSDDVQVTVNPQPTVPGVTSYTLINALTDQPILTFTEGMIIDLAQLVTTQVSIRANVSGVVGSVAFDFDGTTNKRVDSVAPYALFSETGGNFQPVVLGLGNHTLTGRAYTGSNASGSVINSLTLHFQVTVFNPVPDQIHLSWTDAPATSFTIVWRTFDAATESTAQYRKVGETAWLTAVGTPKSSGTIGSLHEAAITGLLPSTQYEYRVLGDGGSWSAVNVTKTAPPPGPATFDFVYLADTGLIGRADGLSTGTQQIIGDVADLNPLLVLGGGDYAYYNTDKRFGPLDAHIDAWFNQSAPFLTRSIFMPTFGNHEVRLQETYDAWIQRVALPTSQTENFRVYSFDVGQVHFVSILAVLGTTGLPQSQVDWIIQDVNSARARGQTWVIPYMHVSAFADGSSHPSNVALRNQLGPVFEQLGVHLVISSHDQNYERTYPLVNVGQGSPIVTDTNLTSYDANDGIVWLKVSPAGKLSSIESDYSTFRTTPPPYWTAARDDTMHHFARFRVSVDGSLLVEVYATPGNGTPSFVYDTFTYSLGNSGSSQAIMNGDYDHNAVVNEGDYDVWLKAFGSVNIGRNADGNDDGMIDASDYVLWRKVSVVTEINPELPSSIETSNTALSLEPANTYDPVVVDAAIAARKLSLATFNYVRPRMNTTSGQTNSVPSRLSWNVVPTRMRELALRAQVAELGGEQACHQFSCLQDNQRNAIAGVSTKPQELAKQLAFEWFTFQNAWWR